MNQRPFSGSSHGGPSDSHNFDSSISDSSTSQSRRIFLERLALAGIATAGATWLSGCTSDQSASGTSNTIPVPGGAPAKPTNGQLVPGHISDRVLVVIDLQGGNDGLSTVVPAGDPIYHDLRPNLAHDDDSVLAIDDRIGLSPSLKRLHQRGVTVVEGVGASDNNLSHFAMVERWQRGDLNGSNNQRTGFLGRLADTLDDGGPLVGVSLAGPSPAMINSQAATLSLDGLGSLWFLNPSEWDAATAYQRILSQFEGFEGSPQTTALSTLVPESYDDLLDLAADVGEVDDSEVDWDDPMLSEGGQLGRQLYLAADLLAADVGTRVIYAKHGDFDTHDGHMYRHDDLMSQLDAAVDGFMTRVEDLGLADNVMVATVSEFGRRVAESGQGLDHGAASSMLVMAPGERQLLGTPPPLDDLDQDGNLRTTVEFDSYFASLAQDWLGVEASSVLPGEPEPLGLAA